MRKGSLKGPFVPDAELEPAGAAGVGPMRDRKRVVQPQGAQLRNVESDSDAPVVVKGAGVETMRVKAVCILIDHTDVIKRRKAQSFDNGHTVLRRTKPISPAAHRLAEFILGSHMAEFVAAHRGGAAQKITIEERHAG